MEKRVNIKSKKTVTSILIGISMLFAVVYSFAFFTESKGDSIGVGVAPNTPSYVAFEYDLSKGESYVNISDKDLSSQKVRVYKGDYISNKAKINEGFKDHDYELEDLKSTDDLRSKLGVNTGIYTVTATKYSSTGSSLGNKGLISIPYFDIEGLGTTNLSGLFKGSTSFNQVINNWNINNVVKMDNMLEGASSYNQDLFNWNTQIKSKPVDFNKGATNLPDYKLPKAWQESYKVIFKDQGNVVKTITGGYHNRTLESTSKDDLSIPKEPVRGGYIFKGWESSEGLAYGKKMIMPNNDLIYESQWEKKSVEVDDGEGGKIEVEVDDEGNVTLPTLPDKEEDDFDGWEDEDGNKVEAGTDVDYTEGDKYKPIWKPKEYTVIFKDGSKVLSAQTVKHGKDAIEPNNLKKDGYYFTGWEGSFRNVTSNVEVNTKWALNPIVEKTFYLSERKNSNQLEKIVVDNMYELESYSVDKGDVQLESQNGNELSLRLTGRPYDRRVQTGGQLISADSKEVTGQKDQNYNKDGYTGTLESYLHRGSYTPADTKYVDGQTSSDYNSGGYSGTLSSYVHSGTPADTKTVTGQTSSNYNSGGYSGTLTRYRAGGSYTSSDTKHVTGQTSRYYNSGGYSGTLSQYVYSGSYTPDKSKTVKEESNTRIATTHWLRVKESSDPPRWRWHVQRTYTGTKGPSSIWYNRNGYSGRLYHQGVTYSAGNYPRNVADHSEGATTTTIGSAWDRYSGTVTKYGSDTRVYRYRGDVTRPSSDTRYYRYRGDVTRPDTRVYRYQGDVTRPAEDTREYLYKGTVHRPESDTRTWDNYYQYKVTVRYREKDVNGNRMLLNIEGKDSEDGKELEDLIERNNKDARAEESSIKIYKEEQEQEEVQEESKPEKQEVISKEEVGVEPKKEDDISN